MPASEFNIDTLTNSQCEAIKEAWKFAYPDMAEDTRLPFVEKKEFEVDGEMHQAFFIFGNFIYYDPNRQKFVIRKITNNLDENGEFQTAEDSLHRDIKSVIKRIIVRQAETRLEIFFLNEHDDDGNEIPFSSRYECAVHGRKHKEYDCD